MNKKDWNMNLSNLLLVIDFVDLLDTRWNQPLYGGIHVTQNIVENKYSLCSIQYEELVISLQENGIVIC